MGAVTGVIGAIGVLWAVLPARPVPDPAQLRLEGSISSLLAGTNTLLLQVETLSEVAGSKVQDSRADPAIIGKQPVVYDNTDALRRLADDGDLFRHLSEPLQHRLPRFIQTRVNIISALNSLRPDLNQGGSIKLLRLTLRAEEKCFESELQFQHGRIDAERNKMNIEAIMDDELRELVGPGQKIPPGTELGPMMPVFVPDSKSKGK